MPLPFPPCSQSRVAAARPVTEPESAGWEVAAALAGGTDDDAGRATGDGTIIEAGADPDAQRRAPAGSALPDAEAVVVGTAGIWSAVGEAIDGAAATSWVDPARAGWVAWAGWACADRVWADRVWATGDPAAEAPTPRRTEPAAPDCAGSPPARPRRLVETLVEPRSEAEESACRVAPADPEVSAKATGSDPTRDPTPSATAKAPTRPT